MHDMKTCPEHGYTEFYTDHPKFGGKRGTCVACNLVRTAEHDALKARATVRLFGPGRGRWPHANKWRTQLTPAQRRAALAEQRRIDAQSSIPSVADRLGPTPAPAPATVQSADYPEANPDKSREFSRKVARWNRTVKRGYVYVVTNEEAFPGLVKVGKTTRSPQARLRDAATWCPVGTFKVEYAVLVDDCGELEARFRRAYEGDIVRGEWHRITVDEAKAFLWQPVDETPEWAA